MASTNFISGNTLLDRISSPGASQPVTLSGEVAQRTRGDVTLATQPGPEVGNRPKSPSGDDSADAVGGGQPGMQPGERATRTLACMEVWGGNTAISSGLNMDGLDAWVSCEPHAGARGGGDIYYLSQCLQGHITRMVLADVSGHGEDVDELAIELRKLMRANINTPDQTKFARKLNKAFGRIATSGRFATAVLVTYFNPSRRLIVVNAGHPRPLYYSATRNEWSLLSSTSDAADEDAGGLPLGVIYPTPYTQFAVSLSPGDLVVMYTDSLIEAANDAGEMLGEAGLLREAKRLGRLNAEEFARRLADAARAWRGGRPFDDDATLIAFARNDDVKPDRSLSERLRAVSRLIGL
jgi:phosphoserine phosphatase RsbU/P